MDSAKKQLADKLKSANNILVTVSRDPSVDQLAACLGLTLLLNKLNKHSVAVFSGKVPSTIEFLKPDETIEKTTDSLRDFIIALDKNKADKLRYKVEDNVVRIFITPYKTSISQEDLEFSQGDFNVDVVVALGVKQQQDMDDAITAHGRILHDATVASINLSADGGLGTINLHDPQASSLSELVTELAPQIGENLLDNQIATALLTGIVAETDRFSNDKTSSRTMSASSALMAAGANQQLVASKLEEPSKEAGDKGSSPDNESQDNKAADTRNDDGTLSIDHNKTAEADKKEEKPPTELPAPQPSAGETAGNAPETPEPPAGDHVSSGPQLVTEPPKLGGDLNANTQPEGLDPAIDPLSLPSSSESSQLLDRSSVPASPPPRRQPSPLPQLDKPGTDSFTSPPASWSPPPATNPNLNSPVTPTVGSTVLPGPATGQPQTLTEIEKSVKSPHVDPAQLDTARDEVSKALSDSAPAAPAPIQALNAQPLGNDLHPPPQAPLPTVTPSNKPVLPLGSTPTESADTNPQPAPSPDMISPSPQINNPSAPPPVPPPMMPFPTNGNNSPQTPPNQQQPPL
jgi:hypothetical protein